MAKGLSLHLGVNHIDPAHYAGWNGALNACEADARSMETIARGVGFTTTLLLSQEVTRAAVINSLSAAAGALKGGDMMLVTYSGHGGQLPDLTGEEADMKDETWCLYDGQIVDDELHQLYGGFATGVRVLILSDSCHSGSVAKAPESSPELASWPAFVTAKFMPDDKARETYQKNAAFYDGLRQRIPPPDAKAAAGINASVRLISGCQDHEFSFDGTFNSAFTAALLKVWAAGAFRGDYDTFHREICRELSRQTPNHYTVGRSDPTYDRQRPFTIGYP
jgi:hypothetical protein